MKRLATPNSLAMAPRPVGKCKLGDACKTLRIVGSFMNFQSIVSDSDDNHMTSNLLLPLLSDLPRRETIESAGCETMAQITPAM